VSLNYWLSIQLSFRRRAVILLGVSSARPKVQNDGVVIAIKRNVHWIEIIACKSNVEIMWNFLVTILQDDFMLIEGNSGNTAAIDGTTMKFEEVEEPVPLERALVLTRLKAGGRIP